MATAEIADAAVPIQVDVRSESDIKQAVDLARSRYGHLAASAACAGIHRFGAVGSMKRSQFDEVLDINTAGSFVTAHLAAQAMVESGRGGAIVLIGSMNSAEISMTGQAAYAASKGGVLALGTALADHYGPLGVRVNTVLPGVTETPLTEAALSDAEQRHRALSLVPLGRPASPEDVALVIAFLVSPRSAALTGVALPVDGGQLALTSMFPWTV